MGENICFNWTTYWPHAVPDITKVRATDTAAEVTCDACLWAMGSQTRPAPVPHPAATDPSDGGGGRG